MAGVSLSGMASGLDTETIITQLMALEAQPKTRLLQQQRLAEGRKTALEDVARQLRALTTAVGDLRSVATWGDVQTVSSSDTAKVAARQIGTAPPGNVTVAVERMARVEQHFYTWGAPDPDFAIDGVAIDLSAATNATEAAAKINATAGVTVFAGVVNDKLVLTGRTLGAPITVTGAGALDQDTVVLGHKTRYSINGVTQEETTATVVQPAGLPGIELTLKAVTSEDVTLAIGAPGPDAEKVKAKVKAFVDAYNATVDIVRTKLAEKKVASPSTSADYTKGALRGDPALTGLLTNMRQALVPGADTTAAIDSLAEIGVATPKSLASGDSTPEGLAGKLVLDTDKLAAALTSNAGAVESVLGGGGATGIAQRLEGLLTPITKTGTGYIARGQQTADSRARDMIDRSADFDARLALREQRLRAMFSAMEKAMSASQTQSSWLAGQLAGLPSD
jgi:flagellar hook-associated protein 2